MLIESERDDLPPPPLSSVTVDLSTAPKPPVMVDGAIVMAPKDVGDAVVDLNPQAPAQQGAGEFYANLAKFISNADRARIAQQIIEWEKADDLARQPWYTTYQDGMKELGISGKIVRANEPFSGCSTAVYPLIMTAILQETSRTIMEIYPPTGPVKTMTFGDETEEKRARADRVADYENWQILSKDTTFRDELEQTLFYRDLAGSAFKKIYFDTDKKTTTSKFVRPDDLLLPYYANSLDDASRMIHRFPVAQNTMKARVDAGFYYRTAALSEPSAAPLTTSEQITAALDGKVKKVAEGDEPYKMLETYSTWKLSIEGTDDGPGPLPYVITVEKGTNDVVAIRRNWKKDDPDKTPRDRFVQYKLMPGLGVYGMGYIHLLGPNQTAVNGLLRANLDAGGREIAGGGFKAKTSGKLGGDIKVPVGTYKAVDATIEDLEKMFFTPPTPKPSEVLLNLMEPIIEASKELSSSTDVITGDAPNNAPVGTTLALIEQGHKIYTAVQGRTHAAAGKEYKIRAEINREHLPVNEEYPYDVKGVPRSIMGNDYEGVDIMPVSDPNIYSNTQRIAQVQALLQLAQQYPQYFKIYKILYRMLEALKVADIDDVLIDPEKIQRMDVVSENMAMLTNTPVMAFPDQDHKSHSIVHQAFLQTLSPEQQQTAGPVIMAHIAEHTALDYRNQMMVATGISLPTFNLQAQQGEEVTQELPPDAENHLAVMVAQAVMAMQQAAAAQQQMAEQAAAGGVPPGQPDPAIVNQIHAKEAMHTQDMNHRDMAHNQAMHHAAEKHAVKQATAGVAA